MFKTENTAGFQLYTSIKKGRKVFGHHAGQEGSLQAFIPSRDDREMLSAVLLRSGMKQSVGFPAA